MGRTHNLLVSSLYEALDKFGNYDVVARNQEYPLEDRIKDTAGEIDVSALDLSNNKLYIFEVKSSPSYLKKGRKQLRRAKKYYSQFDVKIETFLYYKCSNSIYTERVQ
jgi:hypothetical protein